MFALLLVLIFSISSISAESVNGYDDIDHLKDKNVLKSNALSSSLSATAKANTTKVTSVTNSAKANETKTTTINKKTLAKTSTNFMSYVEKNGKFPKVKISNKNYTNTEYLYLISKAVENNSKSKIEIKSDLVKPYDNSKNKCVKGTITQTEYVQIAGKTRIFIEKNKRAPNWASSSRGNIPYNQLILLFSKCLDTYNKTNKLPASVKLDNLDLDVIKNNINKKTTSTINSTKKTTSNSNAVNSTKKTTSTSNAVNSTKKTNSTAKTVNTTKKTTITTSASQKTSTTNKNTGVEKVEEKGSLIDQAKDIVNNILEKILDKLDPSKFKTELIRTAEANLKFNTSKINVDLNGKSSITVKVTGADYNKGSSTKKTTASKTTTTNKTSTAKTSTSKTSTAKKTNAIKTGTAMKTATTTAKKIISLAKNVINTTVKKTIDKAKSAITKKSNTIPKEVKKYLASTKNCQVNNKQIKDLAKKLTSTLKTEHSKGQKIFNWVRDNINYEKYANTRKGALKTLNKRFGNCVDQSHLLIALSRAAGIPARYVNGGNCRFTSGYVSGHVWAQMYINKKWVVADPTSCRNTLGKINNWNTKNYIHYGEYSSINF